MRDDTFLSSTDSHPPICTWSPTSCLPSLAASGARFVFAVAPVSRAKEHWEPNEECWENKYLMQRKLEWSATEGARTPHLVKKTHHFQLKPNMRQRRMKPVHTGGVWVGAAGPPLRSGVTVLTLRIGTKYTFAPWWRSYVVICSTNLFLLSQKHRRTEAKTKMAALKTLAVSAVSSARLTLRVTKAAKLVSGRLTPGFELQPCWKSEILGYRDDHRSGLPFGFWLIL